MDQSQRSDQDTGPSLKNMNIMVKGKDKKNQRTIRRVTD